MPQERCWDETVTAYAGCSSKKLVRDKRVTLEQISGVHNSSDERYKVPGNRSLRDASLQNRLQ